MADLIFPGNKPGVELTPERVMCAQHGEPFRWRWPKGYALFCTELLDIFLTDSPGRDITMVNALLDEKPLCCRATPSMLLQAYRKAKPGANKVCHGCRRKAHGAPYKTAHQTFRHLCFYCVIHNMKLMQ